MGLKAATGMVSEIDTDLIEIAHPSIARPRSGVRLEDLQPTGKLN